MESNKLSPYKNSMRTQAYSQNTQYTNYSKAEEEQDPCPKQYNFYPKQQQDQREFGQKSSIQQEFIQFNALNKQNYKKQFSGKALPPEIQNAHYYQDYPVKMDRVSQQMAEVKKMPKLEIDLGEEEDFENENQNFEEFSSEEPKGQENNFIEYDGEEGSNSQEMRGDAPEFVEDNSEESSNDRNFEQEHFQNEEQDFYGQDHQTDEYVEEEEKEQITQESRPYNDILSQEADVPLSQKTPSPDSKYIPEIKEGNKTFLNSDAQNRNFLSNNDQDDEGESLRSSNLRSRTSPNNVQDGEADEDDDSNQRKVIMERQDRFIIFKMVPQINRTTDQSSPQAPTLGTLNQINMENFVSQTQVHHGVKDPDFFGLPQQEERKQVQNDEDEGWDQEEEDVQESSEDGSSNKQIKQLKSQEQLKNRQKGSTTYAGVDRPPESYQLLKPVEMIHQRNDTDEYDENDKVAEQLLDNSQLKRSIMQYHRSSSEKINQPQARFIQKQVAETIVGQVNKDLQVRNQMGGVMQNYQSQTNESPNQFENEQAQDLTNLLLYERRSVDPGRSSSIANIQPAQLNDMIHAIEKEEEKISKKKANDPETELLKQEYLKLKQTLNKLQKDPQQTNKSTPQFSQQRLEPPKQIGGQLVLQQAKILNQKELKVVKYENQPLAYQQRQRGFTNYNETNDSDDYLGSADEEVNPYYQRRRKSSFSPSREMKQSKQKPYVIQQKTQQDSTRHRDGKKLKSWKKVEAEVKSQRHEVQSKKSRKQTSPGREKPGKYSRQQYISTKNKKQQQQQKQVKAKSRQEIYTFQSQSSSDKYEKSSSESSLNKQRNKFKNKKKSVQYNKKRKTPSYDSEDEEEEQDSREYYSEEESDDYHKRKGTREYDSESYDEEENSYDSEEDNSRKKYKKKKKQQKKEKTKSKKGKKLKININMNSQYQKTNQEGKSMGNEEYLNQQRQIIQQQQYIMAMQQYPTNAQQLLLQPQIIQPIHPIIFQHPQQQQQQQLVFAQQEQQLQLPNSNLNTNSTNASAMNQLNPRTPQFDDKIQKTSNLTRNLSGNQLGIQQINNTQSSNLASPKRTFLQMNTNKMQNLHSQVRSPRDLPPQIPKPVPTPNTAPNTSNTNQQNYLNQLKNRFLQGQGNREEEEEDEDNYLGTGTRNNQLKLNNSTPGKNEFQELIKNEKSNNMYFQRDKSVDRYREQFGENRFHGRTNSVHQQPLADRFKFQNIDKSARIGQQQMSQKFQDIKVEELQKRDNFIKSPDFAIEQKQNDVRIEFRKGSSNDSEDDLSIDEGVKVGEANMALLQSPNQSSAFKMNPGQRESVMRNSNLRFSGGKGQQQRISVSIKEVKKQKQDQKPQAIFIGFEEKTHVKDPFANKPALKSRQIMSQQQRDKSNVANNARSKSTNKGIIDTVKNIFSPSKKEQPTDKTIDNNKSNKKLDKQLRSPINNQARELAFKQVQKSSNSKTLVLDKKNSSKKEERKVIQNDPPSQKKPKLQQLRSEEHLEPKANKGLLLEFFENENTGGSKKQEVSLADMFRAKKKEAQQKKDQEPKPKKMFDQDLLGQEDPSSSRQQAKAPKKEMTKQELFELRKKMMKSNVVKKEDHFGKTGANSAANITGTPADLKNAGGKKEPPLELMHRLALGQKPKVDMKEMKKRTNKNYENLPEIKKKKEEEKKKAENDARKAATKEYMKKLDEKRKQILKKKKSYVEENQ